MLNEQNPLFIIDIFSAEKKGLPWDELLALSSGVSHQLLLILMANHLNQGPGIKSTEI
jgi:hypothetical protein